MPERKFFLIGGFLGAGKTTLIGHFTQWLREKDLKVGLVTNDQGKGLLDTTSAIKSAGSLSKVREITGGCFCCRLEDLISVIRDLDLTEHPDAIIAEPVGSCADLMATVIRPLETVYKIPVSFAPLCVVLDARRALAALGGKKNKRNFHRDIGYVYRKQLEEAEWLIVNKTDLLNQEFLKDLRVRIEREFPNKRYFFVSANKKEGLDNWFACLLEARSSPVTSLKIDYDRYAVGEALLGWVNLSADCRSISSEHNWEQWLRSLGREISVLLDQENCEVGHFKMSLEAEGQRHRVHQVLGGDDLHYISEISANITPKLVVNLRAEGEAKILESLVQQAISEQSEVEVICSDRAAFQPGKPEPTHRVADEI